MLYICTYIDMHCHTIHTPLIFKSVHPKHCGGGGLCYTRGTWELINYFLKLVQGSKIGIGFLKDFWIENISKMIQMLSAGGKMNSGNGYRYTPGSWIIINQVDATCEGGPYLINLILRIGEYAMLCVYWCLQLFIVQYFTDVACWSLLVTLWCVTNHSLAFFKAC